MFKEFTAFLTKTNALALAVGFIIGTATSNVVTSIVNDLIMPIIGVIMPSGDWREAKFVLKRVVGPDGKPVMGADNKPSVSAIGYGHLIGTAIDFIIISAVVFLIMKLFIRPAPSPKTKTCPECLESVPDAAKKCKACASVLT